MTALNAVDHSPVWTLTPRVWAGLFCVYGTGPRDRNGPRNGTQQIQPVAVQLRCVAAQQIQALACVRARKS